MGKPETIHSVRIEGVDRPGLGAKITRALGDSGISFRGISAVAIGRKFVSYVACDSAEDQARAIAALKKLK
jgi:predicted amino acid-binding ACT domain protein